MKKLFLMLLFILTTTMWSQQNKIKFYYDAAGNQITRSWCTQCRLSETVLNKEDLKVTDLLKFQPEDTFSYYPNPVKEELYLKWELKDENKIKQINVITSNGTQLKSFSDIENTDNFSISFQEYPTGLYFLELIYVTGEPKTIKIIKQ